MNNKETKTDILRIRCTPREKMKLLSYCKKQNCKMADLFRPTLEKIVKKKI
tara:strand:+ start:113 stop:265 length:153 start_codon:yes stop_codon:yes gene_type:complete